ncbi:MAG: hydrogenase nickel incorporation protein HypB [Synergistaceae bacterium]|jgi:hydrogenase nickel incorporation protein HypB|nr:hydrogenase nickel incorporation protein HypB [Synergistaceae bacterium]
MTEVVTIQQAVLAEDEKYASRVRRLMEDKGIAVFNIIGSPGCGKTTLLETMAEKKDLPFSFAVIEGDIETARDAERLASKGIQALQINTRGGCHLEAHVVEKAVSSLNLEGVDVLFVENVGNLVCPAEFDIGEDFKIAVSSTPEGADKPLKYPLLFVQSGAVLLTKIDLLPFVRFDKEMFLRDLRTLNPKAPLMELDLASGRGLDAWISFIVEKIQEKRAGKTRVKATSSHVV